MEMLTFEEWVRKYNSKTKEPFNRDDRFNLFFKPDKGFCEVGLSEKKDMYIINQLCGDARFWKAKVDDLANKTGVKMCGTWCIRPELYAYIRLFGYKIVKNEDLGNGLRKIEGVHKVTGKPGWAAPTYTYKDTNQTAYLITWVP